MSPLAALYFFFQVESILRLPYSLLSLMFPLTHFLFFNPVSYGSYLSFLAQLFVADPAWQEYLQNPAETSCLNEDVYFWGDGICHTPGLRTI